MLEVLSKLAASSMRTYSPSYCCTSRAQPTALVETQITEMQVTPHAGTSAASGKTDLAYTLRLSPKKIDDTEVRATASSAVQRAGCMPKLAHMLWLLL